jgi:hypothetical protein
MKILRAGSFRGARVFWAAGAVALVLAGCARRAPVAPQPSYPYLADAPRTFYAGADGLVDMLPSTTAGAPELLPATRAPNASVLNSNGDAFLVAVNGWGLVRVERDVTVGASAARGAGGGANAGAPVGAIRYRLEGRPLPSLFEGLTTAGAWPVSGGFLVQLFRDPFTEAPATAAGATTAADATNAGVAAGGAPGGRLVFLPTSGEAIAPDPFAQACAGGYELFALLPSEKEWFAELRKETASRVELKFLSLGDPLADTAAGPKAGAAEAKAAGASEKAVGAAGPVEVGRARFEEALKPRALASLGVADAGLLAAALRALGDGPWLVRLRSAAGKDAWYLSGGKAEEATPAYAWSGPEGMLAMRSDGWLALAAAGSRTRIASLGEPVPGAAFTSVAVARDLLVAAWEAGEFPGIAAAGAVIAPLPR